MNPFRFLCLFLLSWSLLSCDNKEISPSVSVPEAGEKTEPIPERFRSMDVLPGSKEDMARYVKPGETPRLLAHDVAPLDKEARGAYSYLGAARVFKSICGFDLPEWVEPLKGSYSVDIRRRGPVRHSNVEYKIDPARRSELERLIVEASKSAFPQRHQITFVPSSSLVGARVGPVAFESDGKVKESMAVRLEADGKVVLRASRGPVGWDD